MRRLVLAVDNTDLSEAMVTWLMANFFRPGDELHLVHVIPRLQMVPAAWGSPPIDFLPYQDPAAYEQLIRSAESFLAARALAHIGDVSPQPIVHIIKYETDTDSIGNVLCRKADELGAAAVVLSRHSKSKLQEFFIGSVTNYVLKHAKVPLLIYHSP